jgi:hypothetical protein
MNLQPIDLPSLLRAVTWPVITIIALAIFWRPLTELVKVLAPRINKLEIGGISLQLAEVSELKPHTLDTEIRQLDAGLLPQSGPSAISGLLTQLQYGGQHDYIVIDLGSEATPRWLTSRLYLLCLLITLVDRALCLVFVETVGGIRKRFVGLASPDRVRFAFARAYSWLETAFAGTYASIGEIQFDPVTGQLAEWQVTQLIQQFLGRIRLSPAPVSPTGDGTDWVNLPNGISEHAKWLDGARVERLLGNSLRTAYVTLLPNKNIRDLADAVLRQPGRFVTVVEPDKTFRGLVDRLSVLESLASEFSKQSISNKS